MKISLYFFLNVVISADYLDSKLLSMEIEYAWDFIDRKFIGRNWFWPDQETRYVTPYKQVDTIVDIVTCKLSRLK